MGASDIDTNPFAVQRNRRPGLHTKFPPAIATLISHRRIKPIDAATLSTGNGDRSTQPAARRNSQSTNVTKTIVTEAKVTRRWVVSEGSRAIQTTRIASQAINAEAGEQKTAEIHPHTLPPLTSGEVRPRSRHSTAGTADAKEYSHRTGRQAELLMGPQTIGIWLQLTRYRHQAQWHNGDHQRRDPQHPTTGRSVVGWLVASQGRLHVPEDR